MPRFMSLIRIDERAAADFEPDPDLEKRMGALFEEISNAGVMLETAGLAPTSQATRVHWSGGRISCTDGPFTETKEVVGGYAILQCKDKEEALEWTRRFLQVHPESWSVTSEVRAIDEG
ncbi:YciI family protein [Streptomyces sp. NPDC059814]|uniref:YciI family protein n=1 Tax=unclassified Streptomyces TaxID=2593676 RepID=UPI00364904F3